MSFIDDRIVKMQFDNEKFESGVDTSIKSIDKLKESLNFDESVKSLDKLENAGRSFSFDGLGVAIDEIGRKFSNMEIIGMTALMNLTNRAVDAGIRLLKSFSVDQISTGWNTYAEKTSAVQTIMAATADDYYNIEQQAEAVNKQMELLSWFTDETSYDLLAMTANVGKFTANNVGLEESVKAMQGIANWAAISGSNAEQASRVMINMAQALGSGTVMTQDWMSVETASMATAEFKQQVLDTAVQMGKLKKASDGTIKTIKKGTEVTVANFRGTLSEKWFSSDVLVEVLNQYGMAVEKVQELSEILDETASSTMDYVDEYNNGNLDLAALAEETGTELEDLKRLFEELSTEEMKFSMKTFRAGQEAKTFQEAIDSVKKAADSSWGAIFEKIFGSYDEAKRVWTDLANYLYDAFITPLDRLEDIFDIWKDTAGRGYFMDALYNIGPAIQRLIAPIKEVFEEVFGKKSEGAWARTLTNLSASIYDFVKNLDWSEEGAKRFKDIIRGIISVFDIFKQVVSAVSPVIKDVFSKALDFGLDIAATVGRWITNFSESAKETNLFGTAVEKVKTAFQKIKNFVTTVIDKITSFKNNLKDGIDTEKIDALVASFGKLAKSTSLVSDIFTTLSLALGYIIDLARDIITKVVGAIKKIFEELDINFSDGNLLDGIIKLLAAITAFDITKAATGIQWSISTIAEAFRGLMWEFEAAALKEFATAILILTASLVILSAIPTEKIWNGVAAIAALFAILAKAFDVMYGFEAWAKKGKFLDVVGGSLTAFIESYNFTRITKGLQSIATAVLELAVAMFVLSSLPTDKLITSLSAVVILIVVLVQAIKNLQKQNLSLSVVMITSLATAVVILSAAMKILSTIPTEQLFTGLLSIYLIINMLTEVFRKKDLVDSPLKLAVAMEALGVAMILFATSLKIISAMSWSELAVGLAGFAGTLLLVTAALAVLSKTGWTGAGPILVVAVAMNAMASALKIFSTLSWSELAIGLLGFAGSLAAVSGALILMAKYGGDKLSKASGSILVASIAMIALAGAVKMFASMNTDQLTAGLVGLSVALLALIVAGSNAMYIAPGLYAIGASMLMISAAALIGGAGLVLLSSGIAALGAAIIAFCSSILVARELIVKALPTILLVFSEFINTFISTVANSGAVIFNAFKTLVTAMVSALGTAVPQLVNLGGDLLIALLSGIASRIDTITLLAVLIVVKFLEAIAKSLPALAQSIADLILGLINTVADTIRNNTQAFYNAIGNLLSSILELLITGLQRVIMLFPGGQLLADKMEGWKTSIYEALVRTDLEPAGEDYIAGLEAGIDKGLDSAADAAEDGGSDISSAFSEALSGDSGFDIGSMFANNMADGLSNGADAFGDTGSMLGGDIFSNLSSGLDGYDFASLGSQVTGGLAGGITENEDLATDAASNLGTNTVSSLNNTLGLGTDSSQFAKSGKVSGEDYASGLKESASDTTEAVNTMTDAAINALSDKKEDFYKAGTDSAEGYIRGIEDQLQQIGYAGSLLGDSALEGAKDSLAIASPSKEFAKLADYSVEGYCNELEKMADSPIAILLKAVKNLKDEYKKAGIQLDDTRAYEKSADAVQNLAEYLFDLQEATKKSGEVTEKTLENVQAAWLDYKNNLAKTLKNCTDMFSEFSFESESSLTQLMNNLGNKTGAMQQFGDLMLKAAQMGLDPAIYEEFMNKGPTADTLAQLQSMVSGGIQAVRRFNQAYRDNAKTAEDLQDQLMSGFALSYNGGLDTASMTDMIAQGLLDTLNGTEFKKMYKSTFPELFEIGQLFGEALSMGVLDESSSEVRFIESFLQELTNFNDWAPEKAYENLEDYKDSFEEGFITSGVRRMEEALKGALQSLQTYADDEPIEIVIDMTDAQRSIDRIRESLNNTRLAIDEGRLFENVDGVLTTEKPEEAPSSVSIIYNQTNNVPRADSAIQIRRDTQNLLKSGSDKLIYGTNVGNWRSTR